MGIVDVEGKVSGVFWKEATVEQSEGVTTEILYLYVLVNTEDAHSCLYRFEISLGRAEGLFTNKDVSVRCIDIGVIIVLKLNYDDN